MTTKTARVFVFFLSAMACLGPAQAQTGHEWMVSAPAYCRSNQYAALPERQRSKCDEAAFRFLSKNWTTVTAANGQAFQIALDTVVHPIPVDLDPAAKLRGAMVKVYAPEGDDFDAGNVMTFYFDCHDKVQTFTSRWSPVTYAPPMSVAAQISRVACKQ